MSMDVHLPTIQGIVSMERMCTNRVYMGAQTIQWTIDVLLPCGMMKTPGMTTAPIDAIPLQVNPVDITLRLT